VRRAGLPTAQAGAALAAQILSACPPPPGAVVAGYWPMGSEIDVRPLIAALAARGHVIVLPEVTPRGQPLQFREWREGEALLPGRWGTAHPAGPVRTPGYLLVPLLAFDRTRHRLGYGGGYYDRTLAALPAAIAIGCAYAAQQVPAVPVGTFDRSLTAIATEMNVIW
jgi:5-formyltetrahydrofolate cyclo-ligase